MIFNKTVAFPYPVLMSETTDYRNDEFNFDVTEVTENINEFNFKYKFEIPSDFINLLIKEKKAEAILIIQSKDNKFYILDKIIEENGVYSGEQSVNKNRLSLVKGTTKMQIFIKSKEEINYSKNEDLTEFFDEIKDKIIVDKNAVLAISDEVVFDKESKKNTELFEKIIDENLKSEIAVELSAETIIIKYKTPEFQFQTINCSKELNYPYVYLGLQKAIYKFICDVNINEGDEKGLDETVYIYELNLNDFEGINYKLLSLMKNKGVKEVNLEKIDEIIYTISDKIIEKYVNAIKRIGEDGN